jgi:Gluconate 2-dehydrogenase subunit 3
MIANPNKRHDTGQRLRNDLRAGTRQWAVGASDNITVWSDPQRGPVVRNEEQTIGKKLTRREMVEKLLAGVAAGAAWPLIASSHPIHQHLKNGAALDRAEAAQTAASWKPLFLNQQQNETLVTVSESIVPGSAQAQVNRFIDLLLSVDTTANQEKFVVSLTAVESEAQKRFGRGSNQLTVSERDALLTNVSKEEAHRDHFSHLKDWITVAYYSSEEGMRELGWTENRAFRTFPGCEHQSH